MRKPMMLGIVLSLLTLAGSVMAQQTAPTATPAPAAAAAPATAPASGLEVARMEICGSVMDRKPVDVSTTFAATQDKVYCYLEFKDVKQETTVNVVWTLGNKDMGKVPLTIKPYAKFRTWANKSVNGMKGEWKVEVVDDKGTSLKSATFTVQ